MDMVSEPRVAAAGILMVGCRRRSSRSLSSETPADCIDGREPPSGFDNFVYFVAAAKLGSSGWPKGICSTSATSRLVAAMARQPGPGGGEMLDDIAIGVQNYRFRRHARAIEY